MIDALAKHTRLLQDYSDRAFRQHDPSYLGEVAAKLRLLVVETRQNAPLLVRVMKAHGLEIGVLVGAAPPKEIPIEQLLDSWAGSVRLDDGSFANFSHRDLIRSWAEQMGAAHEDWALEEGLLRAISLPAYVGPGRQIFENNLAAVALMTLDMARRCLLALGVRDVEPGSGRIVKVGLGEWPKPPTVWRRFLYRIIRRFGGRK